MINIVSNTEGNDASQNKQTHPPPKKNEQQKTMVMEEEKNKNSKLGGPKLGYCVILCFTVY